MISYFQSVILGVVEGVTEFLPISSTAHLMIASKLLGIDATNFSKSFEIAIQLGAIASVVVLYYREIFTNLKIWRKIIIAFVPTAILGAIFYKLVKNYLLESLPTVVYALLIGGLLIILFELFHKEKADAKDQIEDISDIKCLIIGLCQSVAIIPGVSRAAATILGGLALNLKRKTIVEFSFLLAVPTMLAATALDLYKSVGTFSSGDFGVLAVGFIVSFVVAVLAIKFLLAVIKKYSFIGFGIYRIILAILILLFLL